MPQVDDLGQPFLTRQPGDMDDAFEIFFENPRHSSRPIGMQGDLGWRPATDVYETQDEFIIQMDLAGMQPADIEVYVEDSFLMVKGTRSNISPPGKKHFHKMEIQIGPFERHVKIPEAIDSSKATATYRSGFLFVHMERGETASGERRSITIEDRD